MKIAVPTKEKMVDSHFGHCEAFTIFTTDENRVIVDEELYKPGEGCGCKSDLAPVLRQKGVTILLAGGIGQGAINVLNQYGIQVYRGCSGEARDTAIEFLKGNISDSGETCNHPHHRSHHDDHTGGDCHHHRHH